MNGEMVTIHCQNYAFICQTRSALKYCLVSTLCYITHQYSLTLFWTFFATFIVGYTVSENDLYSTKSKQEKKKSFLLAVG